MNFSENLSRLRKEKGIKQEALANDMKVSRQTVSKWENGTAMPDLKKLTALAEYFGITMDELLGFTSPSGEKNEGINDYTKAYVNELISLENAESNRKIDEIKGKWKTSVIILSIILAFTTIVALDASKKVDDLQDEVNDISMAPSIITDDSYDNSSDISNDASYEVLSTDEKEPWLINVRFTYAPQTYTNSLKVTLGIADKSGNTKQLDYENKDGKFVLETQIDASKIDTYTLIAKDDSTTSSVDLEPDFTDNYFDIGFDEISINTTLKNNKFTFDGATYQPIFTFETKNKLKSGEISFSFENDKPFLTKKCKLLTDKDNQITFACGDFEVDLGENYPNENNLNITYTVIDENGIRYSAVLRGELSDDTSFSVSKKSVSFPNGKSISTDL
jgi:transcriptional regulator with XRE-family HTH domain